MTRAGPLAETLARLDASEEHVTYIAGEPGDGRWHRLDEALAHPGVLDGWYRGVLEGEAKGRRDVAGSFLAAWLGAVVAEGSAIALTTERRAWPLGPDRIAVRRHGGGWFDGLAVLEPTVMVLPGDPEAPHADAIVVESEVALLARWAEELVAVLEPIFAAVRRRAPFGTRGMWGNLADDIAAALVYRAHSAAGDAVAAWTQATVLLDALAVHAPGVRTRPGIDRVEVGSASAWFTVKGTCCLYYKTVDGTPDPEGDDYCTSCPLRDEEVRRDRWRSRLQKEAAG